MGTVLTGTLDAAGKVGSEISDVVLEVRAWRRSAVRPTFYEGPGLGLGLDSCVDKLIN